MSCTDGKKPLKDMLFHIIGASLKKELVKAVHNLGGKGTRSPNDKVIACITTKGAVILSIKYSQMVVIILYNYHTGQKL